MIVAQLVEITSDDNFRWRVVVADFSNAALNVTEQVSCGIHWSWRVIQCTHEQAIANTHPQQFECIVADRRWSPDGRLDSRLDVERNSTAAPANPVSSEHTVSVDANDIICMFLFEMCLGDHCDWRAGALQVSCEVIDCMRLCERRGVEDIQCRRRWSVVLIDCPRLLILYAADGSENSRAICRQVISCWSISCCRWMPCSNDGNPWLLCWLRFQSAPRHPRLRAAQPRDRIRRLVCKSSLIAAGRRDRMTSRVKVQPACLLPLSKPALKLMKIRADATSSNKTINANRISTPQRFLCYNIGWHKTMETYIKQLKYRSK